MQVEDRSSQAGPSRPRSSRSVTPEHEAIAVDIAEADNSEAGS